MTDTPEVRILFVDDESRILDGLKRSLRRFRREWDMVFAEGGAAGLAELERGAFDIVVSDMRMPTIDGRALLTAVQAGYPDTIRIILSGQTEMEAALRTVPVAHQFMAKPIETKMLEQVLTRAVSMRSHLHGENLRAVVSKIGSLPSPPRLYLALSHALQDPEVAVSDISDIIEQDIGMSAKILQVVNSAFFGLPKQMMSLKDAVAYLGTNMIRSLLLTVEAFRPFEEKGGLTARFIEDEQAHGLLAGAIARRITAGTTSCESAFVASMLHDIGRIVLASEFPEELGPVYQGDAEDHRLVLERELEVIGATHEQVGAYLLGTWGLPFAVTEAVAFHHHPGEDDHAGMDLMRNVHIATSLASECAEADAGSTRRGDEMLDMQMLQRTGLLDRLGEWREFAREQALARGEGVGDADAA